MLAEAQANALYRRDGKLVRFPVGRYSADYFADQMIGFLDVGAKDSPPFFAKGFGLGRWQMHHVYEGSDGAAPVETVPTGMTWIPGGTFAMGSENFYPEEAPVRRVSVDGFWIDTAPVTNRQFSAFVKATGYRTVAEATPDPAQYPGMAPEMARPGSLVFHKSATMIGTGNPADWWRFSFGAD